MAYKRLHIIRKNAKHEYSLQSELACNNDSRVSLRFDNDVFMKKMYVSLLHIEPTTAYELFLNY